MYVYLSNWDIFSRITPTQEQLWEFEFKQEKGANVTQQKQNHKILELKG